MPPLEPNPLSEEDTQKLQQEVKALQKTLSTTVASTERELGRLAEELADEKEKVLQIEKHKRYIRSSMWCVCLCACMLEFGIIRNLHACANHPYVYSINTYICCTYV